MRQIKLMSWHSRFRNINEYISVVICYGYIHSYMLRIYTTSLIQSRVSTVNVVASLHLRESLAGVVRLTREHVIWIESPTYEMMDPR